MKITLKKTLAHFKTICIHKFWVAYYCFKCGLYWQGITHDLSKFSWTEFWESVRYYQGISSPINACKVDNGYSQAWQHHKGRNPHHYEYWTDNYDIGTTTIPMPYKYAVELLCDYLGAARAYMKENFSFENEYNWWQVKKRVAKMHPQTGVFVSNVLNDLVIIERQGLNPEEYLRAFITAYKQDLGL